MRWEVVRLPAKQAGIEFPYLNLTILYNWATTTLVTGPFVAALWVDTDFISGDHYQMRKYCRAYIRWHNVSNTVKVLNKARV